MQRWWKRREELETCIIRRGSSFPGPRGWWPLQPLEHREVHELLQRKPALPCRQDFFRCIGSVSTFYCVAKGDVDRRAEICRAYRLLRQHARFEQLQLGLPRRQGTRIEICKECEVE